MSEETTIEQAPDHREIIERPALPVIWKGNENQLCELTEEERHDAADAMAEAEIEVGNLESQIETLKAQIKGKRDQIKKMRERIAELSNVIHFRRETRQVYVVAFADTEAGEAIIWRTDTGEVVRRRPLTPDEKQQEFDLDDERRELPEEEGEGTVGEAWPDDEPAALDLEEDEEA